MHKATIRKITHRNQVFRFSIMRGPVTRTTITILAKDIAIARSRLQSLLPGKDLSEAVVEHVN